MTVAHHIGNATLLEKRDFQFLSELTESLVESSRINPAQKISDSFVPNYSGAVLIRSGGRDCYLAFGFLTMPCP